MDMYKVEYDGHTYGRGKLDFEDLMEFGLRILPKVMGMGGVLGVVSLANKFDDGMGLESFHKIIKDTFNKDDWKWLVQMMLNNPKAVLHIDGIAQSPEDVSAHFAGDFFRMYYVTCEMVWHNLGESNPLRAKLKGFTKDLVESLQTLAKNQAQLIAQGLKNRSQKK